MSKRAAVKRHLGGYSRVAIAMWAFLIGLLVFPVIFAAIVALGGAVGGSILGVL
jgi:uncharacterized membrane protein